ncbi:MAG: bifunctional demethylmenaquinone methyltransferase/2-methoxy-6-polyprenyl-1,4-benzoquinol methylase UbiE [Acidipila sp.]|nr:bifunctional demethylmenaquinone methyltransferase/2-methoxy-6-polyprenyl-1,4-benzoquinol methylase UbiE [Acidipila sp.]
MGIVAVPPKLPGTRPEGAQNEGESSARIRQMFSDIAPRYDLLNHLLSLSLDRVWRRRTAAAFDRILRGPHARVLDLCCGTGDLTLALQRRAEKAGNRSAAIFGSDFAHPMLVRASQKSSAPAAKPEVRSRGIEYAEADALQLPFADASFDLVTAAFGFRNLAIYDAGLREMFRLLRPGGEVGILEFAEPTGALFGPLYRFYFRQILPRIGGAVSGRGFAYSYLPASVAKFPAPDDLAAMMTRAGFANVSFKCWTGGTVALHRGQKL